MGTKIKNLHAMGESTHTNFYWGMQIFRSRSAHAIFSLDEEILVCYLKVPFVARCHAN